MENKTIQNNSKIIFLIYLWVVMWSVDLFALGTKIALGGGLLILALMIMSVRNLPWSFIFLSFLILLFGIIYTIILNFHNDYNLIRAYRDVFIPITLYLVGYILIYSNNILVRDDKISYIKKIIMIAALGLFIYGTTNLVVHLFIYGDITYYNRDVYNVWSGGFEAATTQGSRFTLMSALFAPAILIFNNNKIFSKGIRFILLFFVFISIVATIMMANRTLIVIFVINFIACLLFYFKINQNNAKIVLKVLIIITLLFILAKIMYSVNLFGVQSFLKSSNLYARLQVLEGNFMINSSRFTAWKITLIGLFQYPMGGSQALIGLSAPHNLWLDVAYTTGVIPFVLLIVITAVYLLIFVRIIKSSEIDNNFKLFLVSITISLLLNCMVEPILGGHYILFMIFIFQLGLMHGLFSFIKK